MSATESQASGAIRAHFYTGWGGATPLCPVEYPNLGIDPVDPDLANPSGSAWARLTIDTFLTRQAALNTDDEFSDGFVTVQVFTPSGSDEGPALALAESAAAIFRKATLASVGVTFRVPTIRRVQITAGDTWYQINVRVPYWRS